MGYPLTREVRFTALDFKTVEADGTFEGYASLFGSEDLGHDIVEPGAFRDSLAERGPRGIKLLFQHDPAEPIGVWNELVEDAKGLYARGRLMTEVARAREVLALMRAGALEGLSIGFRAVKAIRDAETGTRRLQAIDLWEISVVTFPMQPEARVASVKRQRPFADHIPTERELERFLTRDAGMRRSEARAVVRSGLKSLAARRDAAGGLPGESRLIEAIGRASALLKQSITRTK
jgi:HK97 family phage prohead protease